MNKNKIITTLLVGIIGIALVGGTYAWFTSKTKGAIEVNSGLTEEDLDKDKDGIQLWVDNDEEVIFIPGAKATHYLQIKNTANYDQLVRVKISAAWDNTNLSSDNITVDLAKEDNDSFWVKHGEYYYYNGKLSAKNFTDELNLEAKLSEESSNIYKNEKFNITFEVEAVQSDYNAYESEWNIEENDSVKTVIDDAVSRQAQGVSELNGDRNYIKQY